MHWHRDRNIARRHNNLWILRVLCLRTKANDELTWNLKVHSWNKKAKLRTLKWVVIVHVGMSAYVLKVSFCEILLLLNVRIQHLNLLSTGWWRRTPKALASFRLWTLANGSHQRRNWSACDGIRNLRNARLKICDAQKSSRAKCTTGNKKSPPTWRLIFLLGVSITCTTGTSSFPSRFLLYPDISILTSLQAALIMSDNDTSKKWIRGVNLGGWLLIERYIVPYQFAITDCHLRGDFCWLPGSLSAPPSDSPDYKPCDLEKCKPVIPTNVYGKEDYPIDEWHLSSAFDDKDTATRWLNYHFEYFLKKKDLQKLKNAGITHVRVPLPHWIFGDIRDNEPWIPGDRWKYFKRMCGWAREIGLEVWPNIHTAPGSQNGFDNSGIQNTVKTCGGWSDNDKNIEKSLDVLHEVADRIKRDGLADVITGFGLLNEPFGDCNKIKYQMFLDIGFEIMRSTLGPDISLYVADMFQSELFNDGKWWLDSKYQGTYLDSHYYNIFDPYSRAMSPQKHIDEVCHPEEGKRIDDCCFEDAPADIKPSQGVGRIVTEWSAAFDCMPGDLLNEVVMRGIQDNGVAPLLDRQLSSERQDFLRKFMKAQIVSYERASIPGLSVGWFFWTLKTEGGAYAEWDFLRGLKDGWVPTIAPPDVSSESIYGTCEEIQARTNETMDVVHAFPWGDEPYWRVDMNTSSSEPTNQANENSTTRSMSRLNWLFILLFLGVAIAWRLIRHLCNRKRREYSIVGTEEMSPLKSVVVST